MPDRGDEPHAAADQPVESGGGATGGEGEARKLIADGDTNAAGPTPDRDDDPLARQTLERDERRRE
jgi:hypothetical protein